jgi:hypothetical protein
MRFAYLTLDEVNHHLALALAIKHNVCLDVQARPEAIQERKFDAVLCDPDSFPAEDRETNFATVLTCPLHNPVAVHSYNFSADQLQVLRARGALIAHRLGTELFVRIVNAVNDARQEKTVA